jgi:hypothetical protein
VHNGALGAGRPWAALDKEKKEAKVGTAKRWLNDEAASRMTVPRLRERDPNAYLEAWLRKISEICQ